MPIGMRQQHTWSDCWQTGCSGRPCDGTVELGPGSPAPRAVICSAGNRPNSPARKSVRRKRTLGNEQRLTDDRGIRPAIPPFIFRRI